MMGLALPETFALTALALFSYVDLRTRLVPGIEVFFWAAVLIAAPAAPLTTTVVVLACAWGWLGALPNWLTLPLLFLPSAWPVLLTGFGVRQGIIGRADLLTVAGLACLFPWPALVLAMLGLEAWRRWWRRRQGGPVPALPGLLFGILTYLLIKTILQFVGIPE
jgi:hypothetical protein